MASRARGRIAIAAGVLAVVALALLLLLVQRDDGDAASSAKGAPPPVAVSSAPEPRLPAQVAGGATSPSAEGPTETEVKKFRQFRVEALKKAARYPGDSGPLTERHLDALIRVFPDNGAVTADDEPSPDSDGRQMQLFAYAAKPHFQIDEPAILYAEVRHLDTERRLPAKITGTMKKLIGGGSREPFGSVAYRDDGEGGDQIAGDLVYTAIVRAGDVPAKLLEGQIDLEVSATLADGRQRFVLSVFRMGSPGARLTGKFTDHLEDGHLILEAGVIVDKPGRYHLQGGLVSSTGELVAWSQNAVAISTTGPSTMRLRFFGLAFRDANIAGPYRLSFISIAETERRPVLQGPVLRDAYTTAAYKVGDFSDQPNQDPAMDETIKQAESIQNMPYAGTVGR
jgi:hypothetical protein